MANLGLRFRPKGEQAEKLLARNGQIKTKIEHFEIKVFRLREAQAINERKAVELLLEEHKARKYKVD